MKSSVIKIVLAHAIGGAIWICLSDIIFMATVGKKDHPILLMGSISAGIYLLFTSFILHKLISLHYQRLQNSETQHRSYFEDNPTPMWIYNRKTLHFTAVNNAAIANYGYTREEFFQMTILEIRPLGDVIKTIEAVNTFETHYKDSGLWNHTRKDGTLIIAQITSHLIYSENGQHVMIMAKDVTRRIQTEKQLQKANDELIKKNNILSEIAWSQSHRVRKPLASILGLFDVMRSGITEEEKQECYAYMELAAVELDFSIKQINTQINNAAIYVDMNE